MGVKLLSLILRKECRLMVFEKRVLRRIFGPKREEVAGGRRRQHNEDLRNLYASPNVNRVIKARKLGCEGNVARMEEISAYKIVGGKPEEKGSL
jgi:hypothetical protein